MPSYITPAVADTLLDHRPTWVSIANADKQFALNAATRYIDGLYGGVYIGARATATQDNHWPRTGITTDLDGREIVAGTVPINLQEAVAELAFLSATGSVLLPNTVSSGGSTTTTTPTGAVLEETVAIGSLKSTKKYSAGGTTTANETAVQLATEKGQPLIPLIETLIRPLIGTGVGAGTGNNYYTVRA